MSLNLSCMRLITCFNFKRSDCDATGFERHFNYLHYSNSDYFVKCSLRARWLVQQFCLVVSCKSFRHDFLEKTVRLGETLLSCHFGFNGFGMLLIAFVLKLVAASLLSPSSGTMKLVDCSSLSTSLLALTSHERFSCLSFGCASSLL